MGGRPSFKLFNVTFPFIIIIITILLVGPCIIAAANDDTRETPPSIHDNGGIATTSPTVSGQHHEKKSEESFKPSTVVVVCVLTTMFSITFILLLYIKHCNGGNISTLSNQNFLAAQQVSEGRKDSGVDRAVVESLPIFRFGSLRGQKDGLDCAVCLTRFEDPEVLRLLPKCNHAFHVECVDTWLDAHSTCPLCRYKVDPEDVILVERRKEQQQLPPPTRQQSNNHSEPLEIESERKNDSVPRPRPRMRNPNRRVSGRHSSVGEREGRFLEIILQTPNEHEQNTETTSSLRRSFDSASRSVGCFVRPRNDGTLLTHDNDRASGEHRLEHRIIVSPPSSSGSTRSHGGGGVHHQRWSDVEPSDLLYLTSEMIIKGSSSSSSSAQQNMRVPLLRNTRGEGRRSDRSHNVDDEMEKGGGGVMNLRSVSEMTGMSRFLRGSNRVRNRGSEREREEQRNKGVVSRWLAWISKTHPRGGAR